jgi:hypothetical protein
VKVPDGADAADTLTLPLVALGVATFVDVGVALGSTETDGRSTLEAVEVAAVDSVDFDVANAGGASIVKRALVVSMFPFRDLAEATTS